MKQYSSLSMLTLLSFLGSCMLLGACGGGGDDSPDGPEAQANAGTIVASSSSAEASSSGGSAATFVSGQPGVDTASAAQWAQNSTAPVDYLPAADYSFAGALDAAPQTAQEEAPADVNIADVSPTMKAMAVAPTMQLTSSNSIADLNAMQSVTTQTWSGVNCNGVYGAFGKYGETGIHGSRLPDGSTLRFGRVTDPLNTSRQVFMLRVGMDDVLTAGGKRCEAIAPPATPTSLPVKENFWYAISIRVAEGGMAADDQLLSQWHATGFNPFMGLYLRDGKLRIETRYNSSASAQKTSSTIVKPWQDTSPITTKWMTFVFQATISPFTADGPELKVWRDGTLLFSKQGPLGYNTTELPYAKAGYYHWLEDGNNWDTRYPVRSVLIHRAVLVRDKGKVFNEEFVRSLVQ
ncbi:heparin lyase I family protein [Roseateles violae]|uniref:Heparin lyase I family protein n=1 Tax=Roseateles violae TaxID=3058042 RepID=A0ABT8DUY7_9BURK|nr:heparin lyase I family protein [Pelomonas sp. PFR6]MDN3920850.1 heparin lyase I family protein [Pelomonas sp. PFR6]